MNVKNAKELRARLFKCLNIANDEGILQTKLQDIHKFLKITYPDKNKVQILGGGREGGERNFNRSKDIPHFERLDGCWFDFTITVDEIPKPAEIIGFSFEIRFPDGYSVRFLRFDLNLPGHDNETRRMRFHVHPGSDDLMIHSPPMSPLEILHLFLYGLIIPEKQRSS
jgi:hypothetical protein